MANTIVTLWRGNTQVTAYVTIRKWNGEDWETIIEDQGYLVFPEDLYEDFGEEEEPIDFWEDFAEYVVNDISYKMDIDLGEYEVHKNF